MKGPGKIIELGGEQRPAHRPRVNDARNAVIYYLRVIEGKTTAEIRDAIYSLELHYPKISPAFRSDPVA